MIGIWVFWVFWVFWGLVVCGSWVIMGIGHWGIGYWVLGIFGKGVEGRKEPTRV